MWLQCQEAINFHSSYLNWTHQKIGSLLLPADDDIKDNDDPSEAGNEEDPVPDEDGPVYHVAHALTYPSIAWVVTLMLLISFRHLLLSCKRTCHNVHSSNLA